MRRSLIVGFIVLFVCGPLVGYSFNLLLSSNKSLLLQRMEQSWGRKISAREVRMTFVPGIGLRLKEFSMTDDPLFSSRAFLTANDVVVTFKFLPLFLYQLRIKEVILHDAVISIIRDRAGVYNFYSLGPENTRRQSPEKSVTSHGPTRRFSPALIPSSLIQIINATMHYVDQTNGSNLTVNRFDLKTTDFDHENSFEFELAMAVFAAEQNLKIRAAVGPLGTHESLKDLPLDGELRFDQFDMGKLRAALPVIKQGLPMTLDLRGVYSSQGIRFKGTFNRPSLQGRVDGADASFRFE